MDFYPEIPAGTKLRDHLPIQTVTQEINAFEQTEKHYYFIIEFLFIKTGWKIYFRVYKKGNHADVRAKEKTLNVLVSFQSKVNKGL